MVYICDRCLKLFKPDTLNIKKDDDAFGDLYKLSDCPIHDCFGHIYEIDDYIVPIYKKLKEKGYNATFSCSGHNGSWNGLYICVEQHPCDLYDLCDYVDKANNFSMFKYSIQISVVSDYECKLIKEYDSYNSWMMDYVINKGENKIELKDDERLRILLWIGLDPMKYKNKTEDELFTINLRHLTTLFNMVCALPNITEKEE